MVFSFSEVTLGPEEPAEDKVELPVGVVATPRGDALSEPVTCREGKNCLSSQTTSPFLISLQSKLLSDASGT